MSTAPLLPVDPFGRAPVTDSVQVIPNWRPGTSSISTVARETLNQTSDTFERQLTVAALNEPCRVTYGVDRLGAQLARVAPYGTSLLAICIWGRGPVQSITELLIGNATPPAAVLATHYTGTTSQTVDAKLVTAFAALGITHTATLAGIAYSVIEFPVGTDLGDITIKVTGRLIYDPRDGTQTLGTPSTYKYTDNPALAVADLITNTDYGYGKTIDWASVTAAANACDALVSGEKKRTIGITLDTRVSAEEAIDILRSHAGCYVVRIGGTYKLVPDATASSVRTFAKADIFKGSERWAMKDAAQTPNVVEITYTDTSATPWRTAKAIYPANGVPPGSEEPRVSRRQMTGVQRYSQAMREAIELYNRGRLCVLAQGWDTYADAIAQEPGDIITLNDGGLSAGIDFRVLSRRWSRKGVWTIEGEKYDPAMYDSSAAAAPTTGNTTLSSPASPPTVGAVTLTEEVVTVPSGALPLSKIRATWTGVTWPFLAGYRVIVKDVNDVVVDSADVPASPYVSPPLAAFATYTVSVYARSQIAVSATASVATITLASTGAGALAAVYSAAITPAGWTFSGTEAYTLFPGDPALRVRTVSPNTESATYPGSTQATPGLATQLLDDNATNPNSFLALTYAASPVYDLTASRAAVISLLNITNWLTLYSGQVRCRVRTSDSATMTPYVDNIGWNATITKRYVKFYIESEKN